MVVGAAQADKIKLPRPLSQIFIQMLARNAASRLSCDLAHILVSNHPKISTPLRNYNALRVHLGVLEMRASDEPPGEGKNDVARRQRSVERGAFAVDNVTGSLFVSQEKGRG